MTTTHQARTTSPAPGAVSVKRIGLLGLVAVVLNLLVYAVASAVDATWVANGQTVAWITVAFATLIPMAIGAVVTVLLARKWAAAPRVLAWVGLVFALLTVPLPFLQSSDAPTASALALMHAITGAAWFVAVLPRRTAAHA